ncbi:MAG TPA: hypothetical protein EYP04_01930 [Anaerolineae bacterium]|nr:hypothetical protein [Anaerolineae bacterium]HIQ06352.1 hypothetical protein [Anaerolineae bacterium]
MAKQRFHLSVVFALLLGLVLTADVTLADDPTYRALDDVTRDGQIDITDIQQVAGAWGTTGDPTLMGWGARYGGIFTATATSGAAYGILAKAESPNGFGGYFVNSGGGLALQTEGNARVNGNLTVEGVLTAPGVGDITAVIAGIGLSGGGTSGDVTLSADTDYLQRRVNGTCASGYSIRQIKTDGSVTCELDNDTTYGAGAGLYLGVGNVFGVDFAGSGIADTVARSDHTHSAADITSGTLNNARFSAYADLSAEGYLDNNANADLLIRSQADARYVNEDQAGAVTSAMIQDGTIAAADVNTNQIQRRVSNACGAGYAIRTINADGSVVCEPDDNTTYSAGNGLSLGVGNVFNVRFAGSGSADTVARSDHDHWGASWSGTGIGLTLQSTSTDGKAIYGHASTTSGTAYGGYFQADSTSGIGVYGAAPTVGVAGQATATSGTAYGVYGYTASSSGYGVYGQATGAGGAGGHFTADNTAAVGLKAAHSQADGVALEVTGRYLGYFPYPGGAYGWDSGWISISQNTNTILNHNLGGNVDDYVVDLICKDDDGTWPTGTGINQTPAGVDNGAFWHDLTTTSIQIYRASYDAGRCDWVRVRIWVYR